MLISAQTILTLVHFWYVKRDIKYFVQFVCYLTSDLFRIPTVSFCNNRINEKFEEKEISEALSYMPITENFLLLL